MSNQTDTRELARLMTRRVECLAQIYELGQRQLELIDGADLTQLLKVLSVKQRLLDALQQVERALDPFREEPPDDRQWSSPAERAACAAQAAQCERLLGEIVQQERQSELQLMQHRDEAASRLTAVHLATEARGAYAAPDEGWGQLDLCSET